MPEVMDSSSVDGSVASALRSYHSSSNGSTTTILSYEDVVPTARVTSLRMAPVTRGTRNTSPSTTSRPAAATNDVAQHPARRSLQANAHLQETDNDGHARTTMTADCEWADADMQDVRAKYHAAAFPEYQYDAQQLLFHRQQLQLRQQTSIDEEDEAHEEEKRESMHAEDDHEDAADGSDVDVDVDCESGSGNANGNGSGNGSGDGGVPHAAAQKNSSNESNTSSNHGSSNHGSNTSNDNSNNSDIDERSLSCSDDIDDIHDNDGDEATMASNPLAEIQQQESRMEQEINRLLVGMNALGTTTTTVSTHDINEDQDGNHGHGDGHGDGHGGDNVYDDDGGGNDYDDHNDANINHSIRSRSSFAPASSRNDDHVIRNENDINNAGDIEEDDESDNIYSTIPDASDSIFGFNVDPNMDDTMTEAGISTVCSEEQARIMRQTMEESMQEYQQQYQQQYPQQQFGWYQQQQQQQHQYPQHHHQQQQQQPHHQYPEREDTNQSQRNASVPDRSGHERQTYYSDAAVTPALQLPRAVPVVGNIDSGSGHGAPIMAEITYQVSAPMASPSVANNLTSSRRATASSIESTSNHSMPDHNRRTLVRHHSHQQSSPRQLHQRISQSQTQAQMHAQIQPQLNHPYQHRASRGQSASTMSRHRTSLHDRRSSFVNRRGMSMREFRNHPTIRHSTNSLDPTSLRTASRTALGLSSPPSMLSSTATTPSSSGVAATASSSMNGGAGASGSTQTSALPGVHGSSAHSMRPTLTDRAFSRRALREIEQSSGTVVDNPHTDAMERRKRVSRNSSSSGFFMSSSSSVATGRRSHPMSPRSAPSSASYCPSSSMSVTSAPVLTSTTPPAAAAAASPSGPISVSASMVAATTPTHNIVRTFSAGPSTLVGGCLAPPPTSQSNSVISGMSAANMPCSSSNAGDAAAAAAMMQHDSITNVHITSTADSVTPSIGMASTGTGANPNETTNLEEDILEQAKAHLTEQEIEQIRMALQEADDVSTPNTQAVANAAPTAALATTAGSMGTETTSTSLTATTIPVQREESNRSLLSESYASIDDLYANQGSGNFLSDGEAAAIEAALREADAAEEQQSLLLAFQMQQQEVVNMRERQRLGATFSHSPPRQHPLDITTTATSTTSSTTLHHHGSSHQQQLQQSTSHAPPQASHPGAISSSLPPARHPFEGPTNHNSAPYSHDASSAFASTRSMTSSPATYTPAVVSTFPIVASLAPPPSSSSSSVRASSRTADQQQQHEQQRESTDKPKKNKKKESKSKRKKLGFRRMMRSRDHSSSSNGSNRSSINGNGSNHNTSSNSSTSTKSSTNANTSSSGSGSSGKQHSHRVMDPNVRLQLGRAIQSGFIEKCNPTSIQGQHSSLYHATASKSARDADGNSGACGGVGDDNQHHDVAVKVLKARSTEDEDNLLLDPRYSGKMLPCSRRERLYLWAEKEFRNLVRANDRGKVPVPTPLQYKENILFTRFMGTDANSPAPHLHEMNHYPNGDPIWDAWYTQVMESIRRLYNDANLVHGDLSENHILVAPSDQVDNTIGCGHGSDSEDLQTVLIDFGNAVDSQHPMAQQLLEEDLLRIQAFFESRGVKTLSAEESLELVQSSFDFHQDGDSADGGNGLRDYLHGSFHTLDFGLDSKDSDNTDD